MKNSYHARVKKHGGKFRKINPKMEKTKEGFRPQKDVSMSRRLAKPGLRYEP